MPAHMKMLMTVSKVFIWCLIKYFNDNQTPLLTTSDFVDIFSSITIQCSYAFKYCSVSFHYYCQCPPTHNNTQEMMYAVFHYNFRCNITDFSMTPSFSNIISVLSYWEIRPEFWGKIEGSLSTTAVYNSLFSYLKLEPPQLLGKLTMELWDGPIAHLL